MGGTCLHDDSVDGKSLSLKDGYNSEASSIDTYHLAKRAFWDDYTISPRTTILVATTAGWMGMAVATGGSSVALSIGLSVAPAVWAAAAAVSSHIENAGSESGNVRRNYEYDRLSIDSNTEANIGVPSNVTTLYELGASEHIEIRYDLHEELKDVLNNNCLQGVTLFNIAGEVRKQHGKMLNGDGSIKRDNRGIESDLPLMMWRNKGNLMTVVSPVKNMSMNHYISSVGAAVKRVSNNSSTINAGKVDNNIRDNTFEVCWSSYNFDNSNSDLARDFLADTKGDGFEPFAQDAIADFVSRYGAWKYCLSPNYGQPPSYNALPYGNAMHGEVYFNTYGGIDGPCNDIHDGADMP